MFDLRLETIKKYQSGYWVKRILSELEYAHEISKISAGRYDRIIHQVVNTLVDQSNAQGAVTKEIVGTLEKLLLPLAHDSKRYRVICAAHAHIDMNWMWRWDETVSITLDTFRTMLDLMNQYPDFKFSQSQASVYKIVETYEPEMLDEIRSRIKEGRWEVTASTWLEADKNLPNGESQARHLLYTRRYLSDLFDLKPESFRLDFEPDTFGHHANVPEILASGGVKYYYHCRGDDGHHLYRWVAPSGRSILVYREPTWYLGYIEPDLAVYVPSFCHQYGVDRMLKVYGVGDHGGGPTRRDIERILDMAAWPIFPTIQFGTFNDFYQKVEEVADRLPTVSGELNFIFTGCYTSQSRIKRANRIAEAALHTAEMFSAYAALDGLSYPADLFKDAWLNTLFNQFHDIIPGSGVIDTREYSLGLFQTTMATAGSQKSRALHSIVSHMGNWKGEYGKQDISIAEGAGVGYGIEDYQVSQVSRAGGTKRMFYIFNPSAWLRREVIQLLIWDWDGDLQRLAFYDSFGQQRRHQVVDKGVNNYWGHEFIKVLVDVEVLSSGYSTLTLEEDPRVMDALKYPLDPRVEKTIQYALENDYLMAKFDLQNFALTTIIDKETGKNMLVNGASATFQRVQEDDAFGMTAWVVGRFMRVESFDENARLISCSTSSDLQQSLTYEARVGESKILVTISLDANSRGLDYSVDCDWHEIGRRGEGIPQLRYFLPLGYHCRNTLYDIPFGTIERGANPQDVPANSWGLALPEEEGKESPLIQIVTSGSYAFRGTDDSLAITLIRSSYDPDPYPEIGAHKMRFRINVPKRSTNKDLIQYAHDFTHPLDVFSTPGIQPHAHSYLSIENGTIAISAVKVPEGSSHPELIIRLYETEGAPTQVELKFDRQPAGVIFVDSLELPISDDSPVNIDGRSISFPMAANQLTAIKVMFD